MDGNVPSLRILVVDDDRSSRLLMRHILAGAGHTVEDAEDGEEAMRLLARRRFDLVLTDLALPKASGLQVIRAVRRSQPAGCAVIATTAYWRESPLVAEAERVGCDAFLAKPYDPEQLLRVVRERVAR